MKELITKDYPAIFQRFLDGEYFAVAGWRGSHFPLFKMIHPAEEIDIGTVGLGCASTQISDFHIFYDNWRVPRYNPPFFLDKGYLMIAFRAQGSDCHILTQEKESYEGPWN